MPDKRSNLPSSFWRNGTLPVSQLAGRYAASACYILGLYVRFLAPSPCLQHLCTDFHWVAFGQGTCVRTESRLESAIAWFVKANNA